MNDRLMISEEQCRKRAKELIQMPREDLLTKFMFQEQEIEKLTAESTEWESKFYNLQTRKDKAIEYVNKMWLAKLTPDIVSKTKGDLLNILEGSDEE